MNLKNIIVFSLFVLTVLLTSCKESVSVSGNKPIVLTTTGMVGDLAKNLLGDIAEVRTMMGPGVDPHLYKASQGDMQLISDADIIIYNGLHLEGKMVEIFEKTAKSKPTIALGDFIPVNDIMKSENAGEAPDPHIWMNPRIWEKAAVGLCDTLQHLFPQDEENIKNAGNIYANQLRELDNVVDSLIKLIPVSQRVLITSHDAFRYFGEAYGLEVKGLQGISTVSEYGLRDVMMMVDLIYSRAIKAVFVESSVSSKSLESVVNGCREKGHLVSIGGTLFSDSMGDPNTFEGTYLGMIRHNATVISKSLR